MECYEGEVQPYRKTDYKVMMSVPLKMNLMMKVTNYDGHKAIAKKT